MSTAIEPELVDEKKSQDEEEPVQEEDEAGAVVEKPEVDVKALPDEATTNASVLSASEIRSPADDTTAESSPSGVEESKNGAENGVEEKSAKEEDSNRPESADSHTDWVDILGNGQLMKRVLRKGAGLSTRPTPQSRVKVRTRGYLESGKSVDRHSSLSFTVGDGDVVQAWDLVVPLMEKGETAQIKTNSRFAYGSLGKEPDIPANANITYEVELLDVQPPLDFETVTEEDLLKLVDQKRVRGNELFQRKDFERAVHSYQKGLKMIENYTEEQSGRESRPVQEMQIRCWNNIAAAQLKIDLHKEALKSCEDVLQKDPNNVKALFRAGKVLSIMGEMDEAVKMLEKAKSLDSEERAIQVELEKAIQKRKVSHDKERQLYQRMLAGEKPAKTKKNVAKSALDSTWGPLPYLAVAAIIASIGIGLAYVITQRH